MAPLGYVSAAEGFVFLSGFTFALVSARYGSGAEFLWHKASARALLIYCYHLIMIISVAVVFWLVPPYRLSAGARGDCTIDEAIAASGFAIEYVRRQFGLPVVLMGSSMGGLLTIFALLKGLEPDLGAYQISGKRERQRGEAK